MICLPRSRWFGNSDSNFLQKPPHFLSLVALIITEGDSAKSLAMSGLSVVGRNHYGVFPLKGKPLNVREASHKQSEKVHGVYCFAAIFVWCNRGAVFGCFHCNALISSLPYLLPFSVVSNEEIKNVVEIMGLKFGTTYDETSIKSLRYGHLMIMADQDHDGSHIKGLVINFIHHFWPTLLDVPGFLQQFITPIVKATKKSNKKKSQTFFTIPEYEVWKESTGNYGKGYTVKYYK